MMQSKNMQLLQLMEQCQSHVKGTCTAGYCQEEKVVLASDALRWSSSSSLSCIFIVEFQITCRQPVPQLQYFGWSCASL